MEGCALQTISVGGLAGDGRYSLRYRHEESGLLESVRMHGILFPVIVTTGAVVVAGHRRVACARKLGIAQIPVLITTEQDARQLFLAALLSNWRQAWTELDGAFCLKKAHDFGFSVEELTATFLPALGVAPEKQILEESLSVMSLTASVLEAIADHRLPFRGARQLSRLSTPDQDVFIRKVVASISLTTQELIKLIAQMVPLLRAACCPLDLFLKGKVLSEILDHPDWDRRARAEKFCKAVQGLAQPLLYAQEGKVTQKLKEIGALGPLCKIEFPPFFEDRGFTLRARLKTSADLDQFLKLAGARRDWLNSLFDFML